MQVLVRALRALRALKEQQSDNTEGDQVQECDNTEGDQVQECDNTKGDQVQESDNTKGDQVQESDSTEDQVPESNNKDSEGGSMQQNASYPDGIGSLPADENAPSPESSSEYNAAASTNALDEIPAIPPPSYEEVVGSNDATK